MYSVINYAKSLLLFAFVYKKVNKSLPFLHLVYCILSETFAILCISKCARVQENTDGDCVIYVCLAVL